MSVADGRKARHHLTRVASANFLAAGAATFTARIVLHPLDTLRTRAQTVLSSTVSNSAMPTRDLVIRTISTSSFGRFRSLWTGFLTSCAGSVSAQSVYYATYSTLRGALGVAPAAAAANVIAAFVRVPAEVLKQRAQSGIAPSTVAAALAIMKADGVFGLWRGLVPQIARDVPYAISLFAVYEMLQKKEHKKSLVSGAIAGAVATLATAPLDVIKTRAMTNSGRSAPIFRTFVQILQSEGFMAFWRGTGHRVLHKVCSSAIFFASLEAYKHILQRRCSLLGGNKSQDLKNSQAQG